MSLQSVQMNLSRVIGPAIGAVIYSQFSAAPVFAINAGTYLFACAGVRLRPLPPYAPGRWRRPGWARLLSGVRMPASDPLIRRILTTLVLFSFFSLAFVGLMPVIAADSFGIRPRASAVRAAVRVFGLGAALGAISVGTCSRGRRRSIPRLGSRRVRRASRRVRAVCVTDAPAYPVGFVLGFFYFLVITSLATVLQENVDDGIRGRIMALWIMGFGGIVPVGVLIGGFVANYTSVTLVLLIGAAAALLLAPYAKLDKFVASARRS